MPPPVSPIISTLYFNSLTPAVWVFHTSAILGHQLGILEFNSVLTLSTQGLFRAHKLRVQSLRTAPCPHVRRH